MAGRKQSASRLALSPEVRGIFGEGLSRHFAQGWDRRAWVYWEPVWHALSVPARALALTLVDIQGASGAGVSDQDLARSAAISELVEAKFAVWHKGEVFLVRDANPFASCLKQLAGYRLLFSELKGRLDYYVHRTFQQPSMTNWIQSEFNRHGISEQVQAHDQLRHVVSRRRWVEWQRESLEDSLARCVLDAIEAADEPLASWDLRAKFAEQADDFQAALDELRARLVVFEDLEPATSELLIGLLPSVRADLVRYRPPRRRPALKPCDTPKVVSAESGFLIQDIRALLLDLSARPAKLRQDRSLSHKEQERIQSLFEPLPGWLANYLRPCERRWGEALSRAHMLNLLHEEKQGDGSHLVVSAGGQQWLKCSSAEQYRDLYAAYQKLPGHSVYRGYGYPMGDHDFLGVPMLVVPSRSVATANQWHVSPEDHEALRQALFKSFDSLKTGVFYRLDDFLDHVTFQKHNPVRLRKSVEEVRVAIWHRIVSPFEEQFDEVGRQCLEEMIRNRLVPLGGLQLGLDQQDKLIVARQPRLKLYWGKKTTDADLAGVGVDVGRVVVQPDFSVIVIGLNAAPAAELAAFCHRELGHAGQGALIYRISRDSVVRAVRQGLSGADMLERLNRWANPAVPANVEHEIRAWAASVQRVAFGPVLLYRCPDESSAERVLSILGASAERLTPQLVAFDGPQPNPEQQRKLQDAGILLAWVAESAQPSGRKRRRW